MTSSGTHVHPRARAAQSIVLLAVLVSSLAELALFAVLFTDGMRVGWSDLRSAWRLPGLAPAAPP